ncbi:MAG: response regulator transcription factor [Verrucomicrobia bacterium]|nr:response regulator transcription factor [Verrucomicrobiota bacterium]
MHDRLAQPTAPPPPAPRPVRFAVVGPHLLTRELFRTALLTASRQFQPVPLTAEPDWTSSIDLLIVDLPGERAHEFEEFHGYLHTRNPWAVLAVTEPALAGLVSPNGRRTGLGFLSRESSAETLVHAAWVVAAGGVYYDAAHSKILSLQGGPVPLSPRESHVLRLIAEGYSTKEVSGILHLATKTVEKYRMSLMQKLGVHDVVRLTHHAIRLGLLKV